MSEKCVKVRIFVVRVHDPATEKLDGLGVSLLILIAFLIIRPKKTLPVKMSEVKSFLKKHSYLFQKPAFLRDIFILFQNYYCLHYY